MFLNRNTSVIRKTKHVVSVHTKYHHRLRLSCSAVFYIALITVLLFHDGLNSMWLFQSLHTTEEGNTNAQKISLQKSSFFLRNSPFPGNLKLSLAEKQCMGKFPMGTGGNTSLLVCFKKLYRRKISYLMENSYVFNSKANKQKESLQQQGRLPGTTSCLEEDNTNCKTKVFQTTYPVVV